LVLVLEEEVEEEEEEDEVVEEEEVDGVRKREADSLLLPDVREWST